MTSDTRDHRGHPTSGELYRAGLTIYRDQAAGTFSFTEYQLEGLQLVPLSGSRWVLALRGWAVLTDVPSGHEVPIYLQPTIGGHNTLPIYIYTQVKFGITPEVNALASLLLAASLILIAIAFTLPIALRKMRFAYRARRA